jgi:hypothetical protein
MYRTIAALILSATVASAHEMTPTYPEMRASHLSGVVKATMHLFNKREEIEYYQFGVFDENFKPVPFASATVVMKVPYLSHATVDIYIRRSDLDRALYICSESKLPRGSELKTRVSSRICSKIKKAG